MRGSAYEVRAGRDFWNTLTPLRPKYTRGQFAEIIRIIKACIAELAQHGYVDENGWAEHMLEKSPFNDGLHYEFHVFDDDVLVVYLKREQRRVIRMVGVFDHESLPSL